MNILETMRANEITRQANVEIRNPGRRGPAPEETVTYTSWYWEGVPGMSRLHTTGPYSNITRPRITRGGKGRLRHLRAHERGLTRSGMPK